MPSPRSSKSNSAVDRVERALAWHRRGPRCVWGFDRGRAGARKAPDLLAAGTRGAKTEAVSPAPAFEWVRGLPNDSLRTMRRRLRSCKSHAFLQLSRLGINMGRHSWEWSIVSVRKLDSEFSTYLMIALTKRNVIIRKNNLICSDLDLSTNRWKKAKALMCLAAPGFRVT